MSSTATRLEYLRGELRAERISYGELAELQIHAENGDIDPGDVELLEAAGVPESATDSTLPTRVEHTATPWRTDYYDFPENAAPIKRGYFIAPMTGFDIAHLPITSSVDREQQQANAEYIIEAVNSRASLVAEVERLRDALQLTLTAMRGARDNWSGYEPDIQWLTAWDAARAALRGV